MESAPEPELLRKTMRTSMWARLRTLLAGVSVHRRPRRLYLCESLSLGEKRLVAVVQFEEQRFLVAATSHHISLLQSLGPAEKEEEHSSPHP